MTSEPPQISGPKRSRDDDTRARPQVAGFVLVTQPWLPSLPANQAGDAAGDP